MAQDGSHRNSSRKTTRRGARKAPRKPPRFGPTGLLADYHHLLPVRCLGLAVPRKKRRTDA
jgi:hypothetical protein